MMTIAVTYKVWMGSSDMKQVLIADHDFELFQIADRALRDYYKISVLPKDVDLPDHLRQYPTDLILLTISPSNQDSFKTFDILKKLPEMIGKPVIFLAKQNDTEAENRAIVMGADDYIAMPVTTELLLHRVSTCLELTELRHNKPYVEKYQDAISISFAELVEFRDETTGGHLKNTTRYFNVLLEEAMANDKYKDIISLEDTRDLLRSATLHDIGKIGINDEILRKASPLDYQEYEYMKTHTTLGKQAFDKIIRETGGTRWLYLAKDMAYCHHEHWDGNGYPNGLKGEEIPIYARMLTIADVYDALTSNRTYKKAFSHRKAMEIILEGKGTFFDPSLVELFINANEKFKEVLLSKKCNTEQ
jgi:putative two-component system response regulator